MKKKLTDILIISLILTTIGFLMDGEVKESSILMRCIEYVAMTVLIFTVISCVYFTADFTWRKFQKFGN